MTDDLPETESLDVNLDAGLRAAFGPGAATASTGAGQVLDTLAERLGVRSQVLLREEDSDAETIVRPGSDAAAAGRQGTRYQVLGEIARGGVGVILKGRDNDLGRDVAMKVLQDRHADNPSMVERFVEEAQITGQLQHPGVLPVFEMGLQADRRPFFTMKLVKGRTLAALLSDRASPETDRARFLGIFEHLCQTMAYVHSRGVIHRDLKPSNIMVGPFGEVQVLDWGLAKVLAAGGVADERPEDDDGAPETHIETVRTGDGSSGSMVGSVMGTPSYMSPEQARGETDDLDERTDVFALGGILCELMTGHPPYRGDRTDALRDAADAHLDPAMKLLDQCGAEPALTTLARLCLAPARSARPRDANVVARTITAHLTSVQERVRAAEIASARAQARAAEERRARRLTIALAGFGLLAMLLIGAGLAVVQANRNVRIAENSRLLEQQLAEMTVRLEEAVQQPVADQQSWIALRAASRQFMAMGGEREVAPETRARRDAFMQELHRADRDRRMIERIEDLVIESATHQDLKSWIELEANLREAFVNYGIDLDAMPREQIRDLVLASNITVELADGMELWVGAMAHQPSFGGEPHAEEKLREWYELIFEVDPDPFRTTLRRMMINPPYDLTELRSLLDDHPLEGLRPRTLSWLATMFHGAGDLTAMRDIYRRGTMLHPQDFMLNFDFAYNLAMARLWEEAATYYNVALALRPQTSGAWRELGVALRNAGDVHASLDALRRSIELRPAHAPTWVELASTQTTAGDRDAARASYRTALRHDARCAAAHDGLAQLAGQDESPDPAARNIIGP